MLRVLSGRDSFWGGLVFLSSFISVCDGTLLEIADWLGLAFVDDSFTRRPAGWLAGNARVAARSILTSASLLSAPKHSGR